MLTTSESGAAVTAQGIMDLERRFLLQNYSRYPLVLQRGKGCQVFDLDGKRYLDLIAGIGVNALGHAHPRIVRVVREQAARLIHCSNLYYNEFQGPLAQKLAEISGLQRSFFCNSGTEAMEAAIKMIRSHGGKIGPEKHEIVSLDNSFHGRTMGAISVTGQAKYRKDFEPLLTGVKFVRPNDMEALETAIGPHTAGVVLEWIQGEGGIFPLKPEYVEKVARLARRNNALLVFDEIQCGVGRPGRHFGYQLADPVILPDITVAAKPLACGLPLGVLIANEKAASTIAPGMHGTTFGGGPLACRVALEFLDVLDGLLPSIHSLGAEFRTELCELSRHFGFIREVRGFGLMIGMELDIPGKQIVLDAMEEGLLINCTHETVLRFLPPYIISPKEIDRAVSILTKVLKKAPAAG
jgi:acetylornithine/N-succinyldiaminopimelate aminotransferase